MQRPQGRRRRRRRRRQAGGRLPRLMGPQAGRMCMGMVHGISRTSAGGSEWSFGPMEHLRSPERWLSACPCLLHLFSLICTLESMKRLPLLTAVGAWHSTYASSMLAFSTTAECTHEAGTHTRLRLVCCSTLVYGSQNTCAKYRNGRRTTQHSPRRTHPCRACAERTPGANKSTRAHAGQALNARLARNHAPALTNLRSRRNSAPDASRYGRYETLRREAVRQCGAV